MLCALIMAGGSGKRFWPLSTKEKPKQLLKLFSDKSMVRETVDRILPMIPVEQIFIATNHVIKDAIKAELPMIPEENIIIEPIMKDTAAAIGYSAEIIRREMKKTTLLVLPSDHMIKNPEIFMKAVEVAVKEAEKRHSIVTFGIKPTRGDTGYGYIQVKANSAEKIELMKGIKIERFLEKPNLEAANRYFNDGKYLWNSGMFVFEASTILDEIKKYLPKHNRILKNIQFYIDQGHKGQMLANKTELLFEDFEKISIDYGIMEKTNNIRVIPIDVGWSDVGAFTAFEDVYTPDEQGNIVKDTNFDSLESNGNIVFTDNLEIRAIGMENMVIVKNGNKLLICSKYEIDKMKEM